MNSHCSTPNHHPPTAHSTSALLQHTQPAPSYSTLNQHPPTAHPASTLLYSTPNQHPPTVCVCHVSTHTTYVRMCLCSSATCDYCIQTVLHTSYTVLFGTHTYLQYLHAYRQTYCTGVHAKPYNTNQVKRQKQLLNTPR